MIENTEASTDTQAAEQSQATPSLKDSPDFCDENTNAEATSVCKEKDDRAYFIEVLGFDHPEAQKVTVQPLEGSDNDTFFDFEGKPSEKQEKTATSTIHRWETMNDKPLAAQLEIQKAEGGTIKLPLFDDVELSKQQPIRQDHVIAPFVPLVQTYHKDEKLQKPISCRDGYLYFFHNEKLWREIAVNTSESGELEFIDADLTSLRKDLNSPLSTDQERSYTGATLQEIWLPVRENGTVIRGLKFFFSEVSLSSHRLNYLEKESDALTKRCQITNLYEPGLVHENKAYKGLVWLSSLAAQRPRDPEVESYLADPQSYLEDLTGQAKQTPLDKAKSIYQQRADDELVHALPICEYLHVVLKNNEQLSPFEAIFESKAEKATDVFEQQKKRKICGLIVEDIIARKQEYLIKTNYAFELANTNSVLAKNTDFYDFALLTKQLVLNKSLPGQLGVNPLYTNYSKDVDVKPGAKIHQLLTVRVRQAISKAADNYQYLLYDLAKSDEYEQALTDYFSLNGSDYYAGFKIYGDTVSALAFDPLAFDPVLAAEKSHFSPYSYRSEVLEKMLTDKHSLTYQMLFPGTPPEDREKECTLEPSQENPGDALFRGGYLEFLSRRENRYLQEEKYKTSHGYAWAAAANLVAEKEQQGTTVDLAGTAAAVIKRLSNDISAVFDTFDDAVKNLEKKQTAKNELIVINERSKLNDLKQRLSEAIKELQTAHRDLQQATVEANNEKNIAKQDLNKRLAYQQQKITRAEDNVKFLQGKLADKERRLASAKAKVAESAIAFRLKLYGEVFDLMRHADNALYGQIIELKDSRYVKGKYRIIGLGVNGSSLGILQGKSTSNKTNPYLNADLAIEQEREMKQIGSTKRPKGVAKSEAIEGFFYAAKVGSKAEHIFLQLEKTNADIQRLEKRIDKLGLKRDKVYEITDTKIHKSSNDYFDSVADIEQKQAAAQARLADKDKLVDGYSQDISKLSSKVEELKVDVQKIEKKLATYETITNNLARTLFESRIATGFLVGVELWNLGYEISIYDKLLRQGRIGRSVLGALSAFVDTSLLSIVLMRKLGLSVNLTGMMANSALKTVASGAAHQFRVIKVGGTKLLRQMAFMDAATLFYANFNISKLITGFAIGLTFLTFAADAINEFRLGDKDTALGYSVMAVGVILIKLHPAIGILALAVGFAMVYFFNDKPLNTLLSQGPLAREPNNELSFITQDPEQAYYRLAHFLGVYSLSSGVNPYFNQPPEAIHEGNLSQYAAPIQPSPLLLPEEDQSQTSWTGWDKQMGDGALWLSPGVIPLNKCSHRVRVQASSAMLFSPTPPSFGARFLLVKVEKASKRTSRGIRHSKKEFKTPITPALVITSALGVDYYFDVPSDLHLASKITTYHVKALVQVETVRKGKTWRFPAPADVEDPLVYHQAKHGSPDFKFEPVTYTEKTWSFIASSSTQQDFWLDEMNYSS